MITLRDLPSVDSILQTPQAEVWLDLYGRPFTIDIIRQVLEETRQAYKQSQTIPEFETLILNISERLITLSTPSLVPVINASGVVLHTNLGRAPLSQAAIQAIQSIASGYSNLEYDLEKGKRGSRLIHAERLLVQITGAESALVVNNNAAAVLLTLTTLARRRAVVIARSQLVEIGGGFRVPDVMKQSGARLVEIGTTNRVHLSDYEQALNEENPALVLRAHRSNFRITGFTSEPRLDEIAQISHQYRVPVVDDLGSGSLIDTDLYGLGHEPTIHESISNGADLVCFSGDKLLGGPQAGIIIGRQELISRLRKHPLARAIRADKFCLAALSATLLHYLKNEYECQVPIWKMIAAPMEDLQRRAKTWAQILGIGEVMATRSMIGGGSLPGETLPTFALALSVPSPNQFLARLRRNTPPVIARLEDDRVVFDPRTVLEEQEADLLNVLKRCIG